MDDIRQTPATEPLIAVAHLRNWATASLDTLTAMDLCDDAMTASFNDLIGEADRLMAELSE